MKFFLLVLLVTILPFFAFARAEDETVEFVKKSEIYDCEEKKQEILDFLSEPQECGMDEDCSYFDYGYPWQPDECIKAIVSKSEEERTIRNLAVIEKYNEECIYGDEAENKKYEEFSRSVESAQCNMIRLYCYKGYCRSKNYSVHTNDTPLRQLR